MKLTWIVKANERLYEGNGLYDDIMSTCVLIS